MEILSFASYFAAAVSHTCLPAHPQEAIEAKLEKRTKGVYAPPGGRRLVAFIDDLNMPAKSKYGFMPPLELLKLWADNGFWCGPLDRKCSCTTSPGRSSSGEELLEGGVVAHILYNLCAGVCAVPLNTPRECSVCATKCLHSCMCTHRYDRSRCELKHIKDMQLLAAMAPPGGGRNAFSTRLGAVFSTVNATQPSDGQLRRIFSTLLAARLSDFSDEVRPLAEPIVSASVELYRSISRELLPTPTKSHYLFNTRDLARIVQGCTQARPVLCCVA